MASRKRLCFEISAHEIAFGVQLWQRGRDNFEVRYGKQVDRGLDYATAAAKLGQAIMHALACDNKLDNREKGER